MLNFSGNWFPGLQSKANTRYAALPLYLQRNGLIRADIDAGTAFSASGGIDDGFVTVKGNTIKGA